MKCHIGRGKWMGRGGAMIVMARWTLEHQGSPTTAVPHVAFRSWHHPRSHAVGGHSLLPHILHGVPDLGVRASYVYKV